MEDGYLYSEALTVGGPSGQYQLTCPLNGALYEYNVTGVSSGPQIGQAVVGTLERLSDIDFSGGTSYGIANGQNSDTSFISGQVYRLNQNTYIPDETEWLPLNKSLKKVFIHIGTSAGGAIFVTIQFRVRPLTVVPGKTLTVHEDHHVQANIARAERIRDRLSEREAGLQPSVRKEKV